MGEYSERIAASGDEVNGLGSCKAQHVGISATEDRGGTTGTVGGVPSGEEEGGLEAWGACSEPQM
jgi:hypothetical protein